MNDKKELSQSKDFIRLVKAVLEHSPEQIYIKDIEGRHVLVNTAVERMYGRSGFSIIGKTSYDFFPKESADEHTKHDQEVLKMGRAISKEYTIPSDNGYGTSSFLSTKFPLFDDNSQVTGIGALTADITKLKLTEEELREAKEIAEQASEAKSRFLANMSHEIRTPLTLVLGMADLLGDTKLNEKQSGYIEIIKNAGDSLLALINSILDISKIEAEELELETLPFDIREFVDGVVGAFREKASEKNLKVVALIASDVPSVVIADQYRLQQIITNLIENSIKFSKQGEVVICVRTQVGELGTDQLLFSVEDNGIGIAENEFGAVFEMFTQEDASTTRKFGGTGLGLSICRQLVNMMGGDIWVESELGRGSRFSFTIDLDRASLSSVARESDVVAVGKHIAPLKVLVAEDEKLIQHYITELLADVAYAILVTENGADAVSQFKSERPDLVLMDMQMPVMDGYEAVRQIRAWEKLNGVDATPVIALSANVLQKEVNMSIAAGCNMHLSKPIKKELLFDRIMELF